MLLLSTPVNSLRACRIHRNEELNELGFSALQTQDSLGITRARLAKQRLNENLTLLNQIKDMQVCPPTPSDCNTPNPKAPARPLRGAHLVEKCIRRMPTRCMRHPVTSILRHTRWAGSVLVWRRTRNTFTPSPFAVQAAWSSSGTFPATFPAGNCREWRRWRLRTLC